jgi:hypothetical protein
MASSSVFHAPDQCFLAQKSVNAAKYRYEKILGIALDGAMRKDHGGTLKKIFDPRQKIIPHMARND